MPLRVLWDSYSLVFQCFQGCSKHVTGIFIGSGNVQQDVSSNWVAGVTLESRPGWPAGAVLGCLLCIAEALEEVNIIN